MSDNSKLQNNALNKAGFLPNFCVNEIVFLIVLIAQLLAVILALIAADIPEDFWVKLGLLTMFVQWVAVGSMATLCWCRRWLAHLQALAATLATYGLIQLITLVSSLLGFWLLDVKNSSFNILETEAYIYPLLRNLAISSIVSLVLLRYLYVQHQWRRNVEAEAQARLQALQARIRPHFLFNSMNTIASLIRVKPTEAEEATLDLADLFRSCLQERDRISLREELDIVEHYLRIEALRLGERLRVAWYTDDGLPMETSVPALILQPLVENAVYHGIQPIPEGGVIAIRIETRGQAITITIANPMPNVGMPLRQYGNRHAQDNVRQRLALAYGTGGAMEVRESAAEYTVSLTIPR